LALCVLSVLAVGVSADAMTLLARKFSADPAWPEFVTFALQHQRHYKTQNEAAQRFANFKATLARNAELRKANPLASFGVNKFADLSKEEFAAKYLMPPGSVGRSNRAYPKFYKDGKFPAVKKDVHSVPNDVDWFAAGACTAVKNQGQCGSCWAFSATEAIESATYLAGQGLPTLSPEQIVDCDTSDGGCNGGDPRSAMNYVVSAGGLDTEASYPYTAGGGQPQEGCSTSTGTVGATISGPQDVSDGNEQALQSFLQNSGPPSVCVDASSWSSYTGGVMTSCGCQLDHCVQATGITSQFGTPAYAVRNSWATDWGVNGFIYLAIGDNTCCVANEVTWVQGASALNTTVVDDDA